MHSGMPRPRMKLSVSSVGSSGMQLGGELYFDEKMAQAFSILGRIERDATPLSLSKTLLLDHFQYPRSDRAGCNVDLPPGCKFLEHLSVSSVGSSGMQLYALPVVNLGVAAFSILGRIERDATLRSIHLLSRYSPPFSILGRIERDATTSRLDHPFSQALLSVSSVGSSGMQRPAEGGDDNPGGSFQYPRSDRAGCNCGSHCGPNRSGSGLSVSSVGSSGMQLQPGRARFESAGTFSILGRIERDATSATPRGTSPPGILSVSSVGSSGMQRWAGPHFCCCAVELSVSSVGSSGMQRCSWYLGPALALVFQYPRSDRAGCNRAGASRVCRS